MIYSDIFSHCLTFSHLHKLITALLDSSQTGQQKHIIINDQKMNKTMEQLLTHYIASVNFADLYSLTHYLKHEWKAKVNSGGTVKDNKVNALIIKITKHVYIEMIQNTRERDKCEENWFSLRVCNVDENLKDNYYILFKVTAENKLYIFSTRYSKEVL